MIYLSKKTQLMKGVERRIGREIEEILREMYVDRHMSIEDISRQLGVSYVTVHTWLQQINITSRKIKLFDEKEG